MVMTRVDRLIRQTAHDRGAHAETQARAALDLMQETKLIITHWPANWSEDHGGHFDEHVMGADGTEYQVGISSSAANRRQDQQRYPDALHLVVLPGESPEQIIPKFIALLGLKVR